MSVDCYEWIENEWTLNETATYYYSEKTTLIENSPGKIAVAVYPNPAADYTILAGAESANLSIVSSEGRIIYTKKNIGTSETIRTSSWSSGVYFAVLQLNGNQLAKKIIKK